MKVLFDTSVVVPALSPALPDHAAAYAWVAAARTGQVEAIMTWHAFAEAWAVLTRLPFKPPPAPGTVVESLASLERVVARRPVDGRTYVAAAKRCAERGLRSGAIFDALHLVAAERDRVDALVTANVRDFDRLATPSSPRIVPVDSDIARVLG